MTRLARAVTLSFVIVTMPWLMAMPGPVVAQAVGTWTSGPSMAVARTQHRATLLADGRVLVTGGIPDVNFFDRTATAEIFDPTAGTWASAPNMADRRAEHSATRLLDGRVLVAGGFDAAVFLPTSEIYDPSTGNWSGAGSMTFGRKGHAAVLLSNGRVLVSGGQAQDAPNASASAETYDPALNTWASAGSMSSRRNGHTATLLPDGRVLVVGGFNEDGALATAELYDRGTNSWSQTGAMLAPRGGHTATLLRDGRVWVAGGGNPFSLASAEIYDPSTGLWSSASAMSTARGGPLDTMHVAVRLTDDRVLVAGGLNTPDFPTSTLLASSEVYDPALNLWLDAGSMSTARGSHTATLLLSGQVLVAGGRGPNSLSSTEVFQATAANQPPIPRIDLACGSATAIENQTLECTAAPGPTALVSFSAARSSDPDGALLAFRWLLNGSLVSNQSSFQLELAPGEHLVVLGVTDSDAATREVGARVIVGPGAVPPGPSQFLSFPLGLPSNAVYVDDGWLRCGGGYHGGIDYGTQNLRCQAADLPIGTPVLAAADGWAVASCQPDSCSGTETYGKFVLILHDNGYSTLYAHLDAFAADIQGQAFYANRFAINDELLECSTGPCRAIRVSRGQTIGFSGRSSTRYPHLHFESAQNPNGTYSCHVVENRRSTAERPPALAACGRVDPYGIYGAPELYPDLNTMTVCGSRSLWRNCPPGLP